MSQSPSARIAAGASDGRVRRQIFYNSLLSSTAGRAEDAFDPISGAWARCTGASMAGLWLYNSFTHNFELNGLTAPEERNPFTRIPKLPPESVIYMVRNARRAVYAPDVATWSRHADGQSFRIAMSSELAQAGFNAALYVPVLTGAVANVHAPTNSVSDEYVEGIISLHFDRHDSSGCWPHPTDPDTELSRDTEDSLLLMARLTALLVTKLRLKQQAEIGDRLAHLASRHLTRAKDDPPLVRREYVKGVLTILEEELRIKAASIWWRHPFGKSLACLISMGGILRTADNKALMASGDIADAEYNPDDWQSDAAREPLTYRAFRTSEHSLWTPDASPAHNPKYVDLVGGENQGPSPVLIMPIRSSSSAGPTGENSTAAWGVIRCAHRPAVLFKDARTTFDIVEVRILEFIARQIAPVLLTLEARIMREDAIRVIKHDMAASLGTIRDIVHELDQKLPVQDEGIKFSLRNLQECVMSTSGLSDRLARDVEHRLRVEPRKTDLGRQLMPRIKRFLTPYAETESEMDIRFDGFDEIPPLNVDPTLVERAIYNLIINAIKYGKRGTTIRIIARSLPQGYAVDVENQGPGVRPEDEPYLFRMYFRSKYVRGEGSGLGLAIVRQIMASHDGQARLERAGNPTIFRLIFPLRRAAISQKN